MAKVTVKMNKGWQEQLEAQVQASPQFQKIAADINAQWQDDLRRIATSMRGSKADAVYDALCERLRAINAEPNEERTRELAESISDGTFKP